MDEYLEYPSDFWRAVYPALSQYVRAWKKNILDAGDGECLMQVFTEKDWRPPRAVNLDFDYEVLR